MSLLSHARDKTSALFTGALVLIAIVTLFSALHLRRVQRSTREVLRTQNTLRGLGYLYSSILEAESGQRGFLLTNDPAYLRPFQQGKFASDHYYEYVQRLTDSDAEQRAALGRIKILMREKFNELELTIHLRLNQQPAAVQRIVLSNIGEELMEHLRKEINGMEEREQQLLTGREAVLARQTRQRIWILFIGTGFSASLLIWIFFLLKLEIRDRRLHQEALQRSEARLQAQTADLMASNRELEAFSYSVSHDLRAPLRGIAGFSQLVNEQYRDVLDNEGRAYLERIRRGIQRMSQLIDDLLNLARITRVEMAIQPIDLAAISRDVISDLHANGATNPVEWTIPDTLPAQGDPRLMRTALENLLDNARKFSGKRDVARIKIGRIQEGNEMVFFVRDNGAGFDMAYQDKLFQAFQRLHTSAEFSGTGIGLATVMRIIQRHGGRIWAEGKPDAGATFYFTLRRT